MQKKTAYLPGPLRLAHFQEMDDNSEHEVLFYGAPCPRRTRILDGLQNKNGRRINVIGTTTGKALDEKIKESRIILNLHYGYQICLGA